MPNQEEFGKQSPEQIKALSKVVSDLKKVPKQQEKTIDTILSGETEIGKQRLDYLERYFDVYSRKLDDIKAKQKDILDDTFKILNKKITDSHKVLSSNIDKLEQRLANLNISSTAKVDAQPINNKTKASSQPAGPSQSSLQHFQPSNSLAQFDEIKGLLASKYRPEVQSPESYDSTISQLKNEAIDYRPQLDTIIGLLSSEYIKDSSKARKDSSESAGAGFGAEDLTRSNAAAVPPPDESVEVQKTTTETTDKKLSATFAPTAVDGIIKLQRISIEARKKITKAWESGDEAQIDSVKNLYAKESSLLLAHLEELNEIKAEHVSDLEDAEEALRKKQLELEYEQSHKKMRIHDRLAEYRISKLDEVLDAELAATKQANVLNDILDYTNEEGRRQELGEMNARKDAAKTSEAEDKKRVDQVAKYQAQRELYYKQKNNGVLNKEDAARVQKEINDNYVKKKKNEENLSKERGRLAKIEYQKNIDAEIEARSQGIASVFKDGASLEERQQALFELTHDDNGNFDKNKALGAAIQALADLAKKLEVKIDEISSYKSFIDTRLQGSNNERFAFSYWDQLTKDMMKVGAVTPFFKQEKFAENIKSLVDTGIAFDLKQRAFLMTIQEKIANTFEVADGTLLRLIRIQQEDSTAGRLGMESALNSFLNNMYENTEYLKTVADGVRNSLQEMEALMTGTAATEIEYQVQKWMGSLYSVGMSQEAVSAITVALGQIAAGQVDALTGGDGAGNLMVMAANEAGLSIAEILTKGLNAKETNKLLQATVNYLADLAEASKDSRVVQQQLANVFGIKASDLRAATNLASDSTMGDIYKEQLSYGNMLSQLYKMAATMGLRTSVGEQMTNVWDNVQYTLAGSMASTPIAYLTYKMASLLESATGGIDIGLPMVMGNGLPVQFKVSDLMRAGAMAGGILGSLGSLINGLVTSGNGALMLASMGIDLGSGLKVTPRGSGGLGAVEGGGAKTTSDSGYVGNSSGSDIKNSTIQQNEDEAKKQIIEAKEEEPANQIDFINENVLKIYNLLEEVTNGKRTFSVKAAGYGLTGSNSLDSIPTETSSKKQNNNTPFGGGSSAENIPGSTPGGGGQSAGNSSQGGVPGASNAGDQYSGYTSLSVSGWTMM